MTSCLIGPHKLANKQSCYRVLRRERPKLLGKSTAAQMTQWSAKPSVCYRLFSHRLLRAQVIIRDSDVLRLFWEANVVIPAVFVDRPSEPL